MPELSGRTAIIVGASRGLGRAITITLANAGADVVAVSRHKAVTRMPASRPSAIRSELADAADPSVPARLLGRYDPDTVVLVAGASPQLLPLQEQSWETFSVNWQSDVQITFNWLREILLKPLRRGSRVIVLSSGAALGGSPLSGGYAGCKATQRFITAYAQGEAKRDGLDISFATVLPVFSQETDIGERAIQAYAARAGQSIEAYLKSFVQSVAPLVTPGIAGDAILQLVTEDSANVSSAYRLTGAGLQKLP